MEDISAIQSGRGDLFLIIVSFLGHLKRVGSLTSNFLCGRGMELLACWALVFIFRLRFPPVTIAKVVTNYSIKTSSFKFLESFELFNTLYVKGLFNISSVHSYFFAVLTTAGAHVLLLDAILKILLLSRDICSVRLHAYSECPCL